MAIAKRLDDEDDQRDDRDDAQEQDRLRGEPVVALALFEHELQRGEPRREQAQADPVNASFWFADVLGIRNEGERHEKSRDSDRHVDVEDERPTRIVHDPAAERRSDCGADHRADAEDRHRRAAPRGRVRFEHDGLGGRLQGSAADALHDAVEDEHPDRARAAAHKRGQREERERDRVEALAPEQRGQPAVERHDDDAGEDVAGSDPRHFVHRRAEIAADRIYRDVHDRRVYDRHDQAEHDRQRDETDRRFFAVPYGVVHAGG